MENSETEQQLEELKNKPPMTCHKCGKVFSGLDLLNITTQELCHECEDLIDKENEKGAKTDASSYLEVQDPHILRLLRWYSILDNLTGEVIESDMDHELEQELRKIKSRLIQEIGVRMTNIFP